jgi:hypothetical protein
MEELLNAWALVVQQYLIKGRLVQKPGKFTLYLEYWIDEVKRMGENEQT